MRNLFLLFGCTVMCACDPIAFAAIQVAPQRTTRGDSATQLVFSSVARIAARHGLIPSDDARKDGQAWNECYVRSTLVLCGKVRAGEAQFQMREWHAFSPDARSLKGELLDSLRLEFGEGNVGECKWRDQRNLPSSGCPPLASSKKQAPAH